MLATCITELTKGHRMMIKEAKIMFNRKCIEKSENKGKALDIYK